ncbi:MAG TPA: hypothetical protein VER96_07070 [Polyangiaceae bacterium]|nr:hypothetical protein [Polyangiaceae bacterium]
MIANARIEVADAVEVVDLSGLSPQRVSGYMVAAAIEGAPRARVVGEAAAEIVSRWNDLPADGQARCHIPPFGFRFFLRGALLVEASVCWQCNNIHGESSGAPFWYEFDGAAAVSRRLLALARSAIGGNP